MKNWKLFEQIVASIHSCLGDANAKVEKNAKVDGREFDLLITFSQLGYQYLTAIECKDYLVPVKEVEAFTTKSRRIKANKAVLVSSVGFQSGAVTVAHEEGLDLLVVKESDEWPSALIKHGEQEALSITNVRLLLKGGSSVYRFPTTPSALTYYVRHSRLRAKNRTVTIEELIDERVRQRTLETFSEKITLDHRIDKGEVIEVPHLSPITAHKIAFDVQLTTALNVAFGGFDPELAPRKFELRNVLTGEINYLDEGNLWIGFDTNYEVGKFYTDPFKNMNYYCEQNDGAKIKLILVESYQHGSLIQAAMTVISSEKKKVIEVTDKLEVARLTRIYEAYRRRAENKHRLG